MDPIDLEIRRRLDKLKEPLQDAPSSEDIERKLRELKGLPGSSEISNKVKYIGLIAYANDFSK